MSQVELDPRNQEAIQAALEGLWEKAATLNAALFEDYPDDIDVLNRLAKAYTELGQINKAHSTYTKVLEVDAYNPIAMKNLERLSTLRGSSKAKETNSKPIDPDVFLEEPGKTKTVEATDLAMTKVLVGLQVGDSVELSLTKDGVSVISEDSHRLGKLTNPWGEEIASAIRLGSTFSAVVKSVQVNRDQSKTQLSVFIRETQRSKKLANPSFPIENNFTPYVRESTLSYLKNEEPVSETAEEAEQGDVEDLPDRRQESPQEEEEIHHQPTNVIEDEEDFTDR